VNDPAPAASSISGSIDPKVIDGMQALRTGLELARASQLTTLRLQLALHKSNRRTAMQALDKLLDIDAEIADLAATLTGVPMHLADNVALSGFIGLQKAAIAAEKHVLTGGDWRSDTKPSAVAAASGDWAGRSDLPAQSLLPDDEVGDDDRAWSSRWMQALIVAIVVTLAGFGLIAYLWPTLLDVILNSG
jgi:hypothetical protein